MRLAGEVGARAARGDPGTRCRSMKFSLPFPHGHPSRTPRATPSRSMPALPPPSCWPFRAIVWRRARRIPGEHVFRASRLSRNNRLFPTQVAITNASITLFQAPMDRQAGRIIHMAHVASIKIVTHMVFSDVVYRIKRRRGSDRICTATRKMMPIRMKASIEGFQTEVLQESGQISEKFEFQVKS